MEILILILVSITVIACLATWSYRDLCFFHDRERDKTQKWASKIYWKNKELVRIAKARDLKIKILSEWKDQLEKQLAEIRGNKSVRYLTLEEAAGILSKCGERRMVEFNDLRFEDLDFPNIQYPNPIEKTVYNLTRVHYKDDYGRQMEAWAIAEGYVIMEPKEYHRVIN